jgi:GDP-L-fucose synthase
LGAPSVTLWGTGRPRREFLHVDDLAHACVVLLERYDDPAPLNIGTGEDVTIRELAETVADIVGYAGKIQWDASKPDGTPRKLLDVTRVQALSWKSQITLKDGIRGTYEWFQQQFALTEPQRS